MSHLRHTEKNGQMTLRGTVGETEARIEIDVSGPATEHVMIDLRDAVDELLDEEEAEPVQPPTIK